LLAKYLVTGCAGFIGSKITELLLERGDTVIEAGKEGRKKYPQKIFHFIRVGFPAVHAKR